MLPIEIRDKENGVSALASVVQWIEQGLGGGGWFDSCLGHMPGFWTRSPVGRREATNQCFSPSPFLPLSLKIDK